MFYNTAKEPKQNAQKFQKKNDNQEIRILELFEKKGTELTPWMIHDSFRGLWKNTGMEITSVRRALSDMTEKGLLIKTRNNRVGPKGRLEYFWKLQNQ